MSENSFWQWAINGLGGVTTLLERMVDEGTHPEPTHLAELDKVTQRLMVAHDKLAARAKEKQ